MGIQNDNTTFFRMDDNFMLGNDKPQQRYAKLPAATYVLRVSLEGYYLELTDDFELPSKLYGTLDKKADRILNTFETRPGTTGVLLCGEKGSGKTLLTKLIATKARAAGMPTILVNFAAQGDTFNTFLAKIDQPAVVLFDEFEKTYDETEQQGLLTLLDGVFSTKKLCLLTSNEFKAINSHMKNRPGRVFYYLNFEGLDAQFVKEYGQDNLKNPSHLASLQVLAGLVKPMNFDMLKAIIEESNRYNETPMETLDMLNVRVSGYADTFLYELTIPGRKLTPKNEKDMRCNPINGAQLGYWYYKPQKEGAKGKAKIEYDEVSFESKDLVSLNADKGSYEYKNSNGATLKLKLKPIAAYSTGMEKVRELVDGGSVIRDAEDDL